MKEEFEFETTSLKIVDQGIMIVFCLDSRQFMK